MYVTICQTECSGEACADRAELKRKAAAYRRAADPGLELFAALLDAMAESLVCADPPPQPAAPGRLRAA